MRIISGWARGTRLATPPNSSSSIRPTSDRAREALFNILGRRVENCKVLDLFAGTGALGLEAMSRGAKHLLLIDNDSKAISIIKKNIAICLQQPTVAGQIQYMERPLKQSFSDNSSPSIQVMKRDLRKKLQLTESPFDVIFLDPPYSKGLALLCLKNIVESNLIGSESLIIVEERSSEVLPESLSNISLSDKRRYGDTSFWFYRKDHQ